jgi:hypothetical protein
MYWLNPGKGSGKGGGEQGRAEWETGVSELDQLKGRTDHVAQGGLNLFSNFHILDLNEFK